MNSHVTTLIPVYAEGPRRDKIFFFVTGVCSLAHRENSQESFSTGTSARGDAQFDNEQHPMAIIS